LKDRRACLSSENFSVTAIVGDGKVQSRMKET
jgi:hypothetical protein